VIVDEDIIEAAAQRIADAASSPAQVVLFGSAARGELTPHSDLDFLVIEREVKDRAAESVRLRRAVGRIGWSLDIVVIDEQLARSRANVPGSMVDRALTEGRVLAHSES
jgi:predicted nucleotidyltransferase